MENPLGIGMSTSIFNGIMNEFLGQLNQILGEKEPGVKDAYRAFQTAANSSDGKKKRLPMELFMTKIGDHGDLIRSRDIIFVLDKCNEIPFLKPMNIPKHWVEEFDDDQKEAMWTFLNMLLEVGSLLMSIPQPLLNNVEGIATQMLQNGTFQDNPQLLNPSGLMKLFQSMSNPQLPSNKK